MDRRKFLRGAGLVSLFAGSAVGGKIVIEEQKKKKEDISHLAPDNPVTLQLQANPKKVDSPVPVGNGFYIIPTQEYQNKVEMSVGKDNRLWIKVDNQWKRVALDV